jgi:hypothetical protein
MVRLSLSRVYLLKTSGQAMLVKPVTSKLTFSTSSQQVTSTVTNLTFLLLDLNFLELNNLNYGFCVSSRKVNQILIFLLLVSQVTLGHTWAVACFGLITLMRLSRIS